MKKRTLVRIGGLALVLSLISTGLLSTTLAKYTTTVTGSGTAVVAAWSFKANGKGSGQTIDNVKLVDTVHTENISANVIAPGTDGKFIITIDGSGSETAISYNVTFDNLQNIPTNLKFYSDETFATEYDNLAAAVFNGTIDLADIETPVDKTVYWKWEYYTSDDGDVADTLNQNLEPSFDITVTGTQVKPAQP